MKKKHKGLRERNGYWHYRIVLKGLPEESGSTDLVATEQNVKAALKIRSGVLDQMRSGIANDSAPIAFPEGAGFFIAWCEVEYRTKPSTWKRIKGSIGSMVEFWADRDVSTLRPGDTEDYKTHRRAVHGVQEVTLHNDLCNLSLFNRYAKKKRWTDVNLLEDVDIPSGDHAVRMHVLTEEEEEKYFAEAERRSPDLHDVGRLMVDQGCRPAEIMSLPQTAVDLDAGKIHILGGKTRAATRELDLTTENIAILKKRMTREKWVFPSSRKPGHHIGSLQTIHDNICRDAGVSFVLYDLRHTFATRFAESNSDPYALAAILGHAGLRCVMKYVHVQQEHMKRGMDRFEAARNRKKLRVVGR